MLKHFTYYESRLVIAFFISMSLYSLQTSASSDVVLGEGTLSLNGVSQEQIFRCNYGIENGVSIENSKLNAEFRDADSTASYIRFKSTNNGSEWTSEGLNSINWKRKDNNISGISTVRNTNNSNETAEITFDFQCEPKPLAKSDKANIEQPEIVKDVGDTAKNQSRNEILNETRKGVKETFKSIFK